MENIVIPLTDTINEFNKQNIMIIFWWIKIINTEIGIIFWIVIIKNVRFHWVPSIIEIIQKWNGNIPSFIKIAKKIRIINILFNDFELTEIVIMIILDEILWIKKYNIVDFSLKIFWLTVINGIIENRLTSILIHILKKDLEDRQIKILLINLIKKRFFWIKKELFISWLITIHDFSRII